MRRPLAIFTPLPPSRSGIGVYALEQIAVLARAWEPTVVIADNAPDPDGLPVDVPVFRQSEWRSDAVRDFSTRRLYHLGNNIDHEFVFRELLARPDTAILHDVNLHHLIHCATALRGNLEDYWKYFRAQYGASSKRLAGLWIAGFADDRHRIYEMPLNRVVLDSLRGVVVHSAHAEAEVRALVPELPLCRTPHHFMPPTRSAGSREAARARLGLPRDESIIVSAGFVSDYKQIGTALRALSRARTRLPRFRYILAGEAWDKGKFRQEIHREGLSGVVTLTDYLPLQTMDDYIDAADLVICLRWPTAGESSGVLARALGAGRCVIVYDFAAFADIPDNVAIKLPLDTRDTTALEEAIVRATTDSDWRSQFEGAAKTYARRDLDIERCVATISDFLRETYAQEASVSPGAVSTIDPDDRPLDATEAATLISQAMQQIASPAAQEYFGLHAKRHAQVASHLPRGGQNMAALELGCFQVFMPLLRHRLGYATVIGADQTPFPPLVHREERIMPYATGEDRYPCALFDFQNNRFPFDDCTFDFVLCGAVVEHLGLDPMFMMSEINRILKFNGVLVIETCNIVCNHSVAGSLLGYSPYLHNKYQRCRSTDRHNIEFAPLDLRQLVEAAGMKVHRFESFDCYDRPDSEAPDILRKHRMPQDLRGDEILAVGVKVTDIVDRFPPILYEPGPTVRRSSSLGPWVEVETREYLGRAKQ